jgi:CheY-like chemotaxis protein
MSWEPKSIDVLLVDDDQELSEIIASYFVKTGQSIRAAATGTLAFEMLEHIEPRAAILDYHLPDLTGLDVAFRLHGLRPALPIVLTSRHLLEGLQREALEKAGIRVLLYKPVCLRELYEIVRQLIH